MRWKKTSNLIITIILTVAFAITTLLNIIGPLHINATGSFNSPGPLSIYSLIYFIFSFAILWGLYFSLRTKPELLFFLLIVYGISVIILENFLWAVTG